MNTAMFLSIPASMFPDQEILVFEGRRFDYQSLQDRVNRLAGGLKALGLGRSDRLAVLQTNCNEYVEAYYAASKLGLVFIPLNYRAKLDELRYMLTDSEATAVMVGDRYVELIEKLKPGLGSVRVYISIGSGWPGMVRYGELLGAEPEEIEAEVDDGDLNVLMYTSGTTALPKGVMLTYGDFSEYVLNSVEPADGTDRGSFLLAVPLYHIAGLTSIMTNIYTGRRLVMLAQFEPGLWLRTVEQERITHAFVVPTMLKRILDHPDFDSTDLSSLQILSYGAAPMPLPVIRRAIERFPKTVGFINAFGQTETTSTVTVLGPEDHRLEGPPEEVEKKLRRLSSIGRPLPDVELKIVDEAGNELPPGQVGEIAIRSARVMKGYWKREAETAQTLAGGWIRTRDMGWVDEDGYVYLAGRKSDMIIRGGENIAPEEVEAVLHTHPAVDEAAVFGVPDEEWGERVAAAVVLKPGMQATAEELIEYCRQRLASFKKPELIFFVESLPRNPMGKVLKKDLRQTFTSRVGGP
jgi:acyl-CoA synthetase (AMP-forming)/AMP-acid ligase II